MDQNYEPVYAKRLIMVFFKVDADENFAEAFGEALGNYKLKEISDRYDGFLYETLPGKEEEACEEFMKQEKFVETAYRFDLKMDKRFYQIKKIRSVADDMEDLVHKDSEYKKELEKLREYLEEIK